MRLGQLGNGIGHLRMDVLPAWAHAVARSPVEADQPGAPLVQPHCLPPPAKDRLGEAGAAATVLQRQPRLERAPRGTVHLRRRKA